MSDPTPLPTVGLPLPRAADAHRTSEKLKWILAYHGHGREWERVFRIGDEDAERPLTLGTRTATVTTSWHYAAAGDAPRLVTAYPTL